METVAPGIYRMENGSYRVIARVGDRRSGRQKEKRFPKGTGRRKMLAWQSDMRASLRRETLRPVLGTLAADTETYLHKPEVRRLASYKTRLSDARSWCGRFGHLRRDQITSVGLQEQIDDWVRAGVAAWTIRHRINALRQVYKVLDGEHAFNPVLDVTAPSKPRTIPRAIDYDTIRTTFNQMRPSATKGFLMIVAFCGFRPEEIRRTEPWMIRVEDDKPSVIRNTAKGGDVTVVPLSAEGVLAWKMFIEHRGLDRRGQPPRARTFPNANRDWKAAMTRGGFAPTRCYDLVHSYCTQLLMQGGGDVSLVQKARGHRDIRTTLVYTQVAVDPRLADAVEKAFTLHPTASRVAASRGGTRK